MYKKFFHLRHNPFDLSPDPYFLYPTSRHYEALACLYYGIRARKGFVALTGEIGTGKTLVVRCLLEKLEKNQVHYAYMFNPQLSPRGFLRYLAADLGLPAPGKGKSELLLSLNEFLIRRHSEGSTCVFVVDEAHLLRRDVLEEIRLLTNLETNRDKLLQIALVGQPELDQVLDSPSLRQLKQRIALRYRLQPLTLEETRGYLNWRLKLAGANAQGPCFPEESVQAVFRHSQGYPRLINTICENAMISAYAAGTQTISVALIEEASHDLRLEPGAASSCKPDQVSPGPAGHPTKTDLANGLLNLVDAVETETKNYLGSTGSPSEKNS